GWFDLPLGAYMRTAITKVNESDDRRSAGLRPLQEHRQLGDIERDPPRLCSMVVVCGLNEDGLTWSGCYEVGARLFSYLAVSVGDLGRRVSSKSRQQLIATSLRR